MNSYSNFKNYYLHKKYYGHVFLMPPEKYINFLKTIYDKFKHTSGPKTLIELKRLAIQEAKKVAKSENTNSKKFKRRKENTNPSKEEIITFLKAVYNILNPLLVKVNHNFKNERRKHFEDNMKYMEIIKQFTAQKETAITHTLKSMCKAMNLSMNTVQNKLHDYLNADKENEDELSKTLNMFKQAGKMFVLAPKGLTLDEIKDILKFYWDNLSFILSSNNSHMKKHALVLINDIIYENFGLEEEQIFTYIEEKKLTDNPQVNEYVTKIKNIIRNNYNSLFDN